MTVYHTAYHTTACVNHRMSPVVDMIHEAQLRDHLLNADGVAYVETSTGAQGEVKAFKHPLYIHKWTNPRDHAGANTATREPILAMDVRAAGRIDVKGGTDIDSCDLYKVTNSTMYKNLVLRAALTSTWLVAGPNAFRQITPVATAIFAAWIGEKVAFRYNLDPKARIDLMIVAALFYQSNHLDGLEFDKSQEGRYLSAVAGAMKVNVTEVARIYDQTQAITSIADFCTKVKAVLNNVRLEDFNEGLLVSLMGSTWGGDNAVELVAVALEHPPTWISLLLEAYTNTAMRAVGLSKIVERRHYKEGLEKLVPVVRSLAPDSIALLTRRRAW